MAYRPMTALSLSAYRTGRLDADFGHMAPTQLTAASALATRAGSRLRSRAETITSACLPAATAIGPESHGSSGVSGSIFWVWSPSSIRCPSCSARIGTYSRATGPGSKPRSW